MSTSLSTLQILEKLASFATVSRDSNLPMIDWMRNFLADQGIESVLVPNAEGTKANLFASIGPQEEGGLVLSGHTDVVPVDGQPWSSDPFRLTARGSRLYARGACDMKGFIAAALAHVPSWNAARLSRPVHLMFSYDEEVGCLGAPSMIAAAQSRLPRPNAVIVGEPTGMRIATQHKGICRLRTSITGIEAHSSLTHQGVSAVMLSGELIAHLSAVAAELATDTQSRVQDFEPPYTSLSVNRIAGGTADNILAGHCEFMWEIRALPGQSPSSIIDGLTRFSQARLAALASAGKICAMQTAIQAQAPPLKSDDGPAYLLARNAAADEACAVAAPFATEAGQFQSAGWSTVVCGPGSIEQAHKADEFVEQSELLACEKFLARAVRLQCE